VLLTYAAALVIGTGLTNGMNAFAFGTLLLVCNVVVIVLALGMGAYRHAEEDRKQWAWRRVLSTQELAILEAVMEEMPQKQLGGFGDEGALELVSVSSERGAAHRGEGGAAGSSATERSVDRFLLRQHLVEPADVCFDEKVGMGGYGDVFRGSCLGQPVAIKTMRKVKAATAKSFRREISMTASLRHPNIVNFVSFIACFA
jgi:hypothetical protein